MALQEIPEPWRKAVCAALNTGDSGRVIEWTADAKRRFLATPNADWAYEVYETIVDFLSSERPQGCLVSMPTPAGETYEFLFTFKGTQLYGKILLRKDKKTVVLFSAHRPLKAKLSCE